MTGQEAAALVKAFNEAADITVGGGLGGRGVQEMRRYITWDGGVSSMKGQQVPCIGHVATACLLSWIVAPCAMHAVLTVERRAPPTPGAQHFTQPERRAMFQCHLLFVVQLACICGPTLLTTCRTHHPCAAGQTTLLSHPLLTSAAESDMHPRVPAAAAPVSSILSSFPQGAVLTKMDGDSRGGAALSVREVSHAAAARPPTHLGASSLQLTPGTFMPHGMSQGWRPLGT